VQDSGHFLPIPPYVSGQVSSLTPGYLRTLGVVSGNGRWLVARQAVTPVGRTRPRFGPKSALRPVTKGFKPHFAADARMIPAFERSGKG
jgi:hypothetical protein